MPDNPEVFYPAEVIGLIADLMKRVKAIENNARVAERAAELDAAEPDYEEAPSSPAFSPYRYYIVRCDSTNDGAGLFLGRIMEATGSSSKYVASNNITILVTVDVPSNLSMPAQNDIVGAFYMGNYGDSKPRFVLLGSGGGAVNQYRFKEMFGDYYRCRTWDGTTEGSNDVYVAKPYYLRRGVFHGATINSITYTFSSNHTSRWALNTTNGRTIYQIIVPEYQTDDQIYGAALAGGIAATTDAGSPITVVDQNPDGRFWVRFV